MRVLLTGGTGFLGRALVRAFESAGHTVVLFARSARASGLGAQAIDADVRDRDAFARAAEGCDGLVHAAALVSIWQKHPARFDEVNIGGLENAIAAARHAGLARLVYTSSFLARPPDGAAEPLRANDYQRTKAIALRRAREAGAQGAPLVILVPGVVFGPGLSREANLVGRLTGDHLAGRLPGIVGGARVWSFAFIDEVAAAHVTALERGRPGAEYGLGGQNLPQRAIFTWLRERFGRAEPREIPVRAARAAGLLEEWRARLTGAHPLLTRGAVEIFRHDWSVDSTGAIADLGYRIRSLSDGLALTVTAQAAGTGSRP